MSDNSPEQFGRDHALLMEQLSRQGNDVTWYCNLFKSFNPYPIEINQEEYLRQHNLQRVLYKAIKGIVTNFFNDVRLQALYGFSDEIMDLLSAVRDQDYLPGSYRPDILYDDQGDFKICEINARFPTNGYFITQYINNVVPQLTYLQQVSKSRAPENSQEPFYGRFSPGSKIFILKGSEEGRDAHFLKYEASQLGHECLIVEPSEMSHINLDEADFVMELHQHELLGTHYRESIKRLVRSRPYLNDLRTIFLVHDKRFLAALYRDDIRADYLSSEDARSLKDHLLPTFAIKGDRDLLIRALSEKDNWVLKANLLGKGQGIVFGKTAEMDIWQDALRQTFYSDFVLQEHVQQKLFPIVCDEDGQVASYDVNLVGTMLCFDDRFLGPGIYRALAPDTLKAPVVLFPLVI